MELPPKAHRMFFKDAAKPGVERVISFVGNLTEDISTLQHLIKVTAC